MRHKDPCKGYILCCVVCGKHSLSFASSLTLCGGPLQTRTVCQNVLVGSVSFAAPGPRAMHNNSTAQEVTVVTPYAKDFEFRVSPFTEPSSSVTAVHLCCPSSGGTNRILFLRAQFRVCHRRYLLIQKQRRCAFHPYLNSLSGLHSSSTGSPSDVESCTAPTIASYRPQRSWDAVSLTSSCQRTRKSFVIG